MWMASCADGDGGSRGAAAADPCSPPIAREACLRAGRGCRRGAAHGPRGGAHGPTPRTPPRPPKPVRQPPSPGQPPSRRHAGARAPRRPPSCAPRGSGARRGGCRSKRGASAGGAPPRRRRSPSFSDGQSRGPSQRSRGGYQSPIQAQTSRGCHRRRANGALARSAPRNPRSLRPSTHPPETLYRCRAPLPPLRSQSKSGAVL
mmetsp:Transcript_66218/g.209292  ORF Transcript_66218/g.209292 Transcript_66218/m.209292 type:complete len:203 (-) Transcript_66218:431-1039(-)